MMRRNACARLFTRLERQRWFTSAAAVSAVAASLLAQPVIVLAQAGGTSAGRPMPTAQSSSGFARTVQHLMDQARREADVGNLDTAIHTALRAKKIAEAATTTLGASPDCSPAAADQLYRELLAQRPPVTPPLATPVATKAEPVPPPRSPVVSAPARPTPPAEGEMWRPLSVKAKVAAAVEPTRTATDVVAAKPVALKRSPTPFAPVATELGLQSSLAIVGGNRTAKVDLRSRNEIPLEEPAVAAKKPEMPVEVEQSIVDVQHAPPVVTQQQEMKSVPMTSTQPQAIRESASQWNSVGAVVAPRQRLARVDALHTDGWQSSIDAKPAVTRAGGAMAGIATPSPETVSPAAYRRGQESLAGSDASLAENAASRVAPPPPLELDETDVALQSPSVWIRDTTPVLAPTPEPQAAVSPTPWQAFSKWSQQRGWTASSAAMGLAAAVLALAACMIALFPRSKTRG